MNPHPLARIAGAVLLAVLVGAAAASAQTPENVALVINENSAASERIGEHYVAQRGLPAQNVIRIRTSEEDTIQREAYLASIEQPIAAALTRARAEDRVLYIVLTKGVPLRIVGTQGAEGTTASVDSELTLLYRKMTGHQVQVRGPVDNPYFLADRPVAEARPFTHRDHDIYLVSRLDAFTAEEAMALVDRGGRPSFDGQFVLDQRDALVNRTGEDWLAEGARRLADQGFGERVVLETTPQAARDVTPVIGYYGWGSADPRNRERTVRMGFVPGALATTFVSTSARTMREPPETWLPTDDWNNRARWHEGSPQSLVGDLIREGATGAAGYVSEPYLQGSIRPQVLFSAYVAGFNLVESFYLAMPSLGWQTVVIGDPLCTPFSRRPLARSEIEASVDAATQLPGYFAARRLASAMQALPGVPERALALAVRANGLITRGEPAAAVAALEQATELAPGVAAWHLTLGVLHDAAARYGDAVTSYRRALALEPESAVALNNLAYALAVHQGRADEALPLAEKAVSLVPRDPGVIDTLAWVHHLRGDDEEAARLIAQATKAAPRNAELRLHAAFIYAATGARAVADIELKEAVRLAPELLDRDDVRQLQNRLTP